MRGQIPRWDAQLDDGSYWSGGESAYVGSAPTAGARKIRKEFTAVATTDGSGLASFSYPGGAFPNGIVTMIITPGDTANSLGYFQVPIGSQTLSAAYGYAWKATPNAVVVSGSVRANIIAVGW